MYLKIICRFFTLFEKRFSHSPTNLNAFAGGMFTKISPNMVLCILRHLRASFEFLFLEAVNERRS